MNTDDLDLLEQYFIAKARDNFWAFRCYMRPKRIKGWFQYEVCTKLQLWYDEYIKGNRPVLILCTPPQHGKSDMVTDFLAWISGKLPDKRAIYASFSERLAVRANLAMQRTLSSTKFSKVFPCTQLPTFSNNNASRSREFIEYVCNNEITGGSFRNTTVRGSITGESLDIGVIDDPIKGREEANSATVREKTWEWFTDDFLTRFADDGGLISIATRWHIDDPIGRLIERYPKCIVASYPAVATHDEPHRKEGEALFPEHKSLDFLLDKKAMMSVESWTSLYQQSPIVTGGNIIKSEYIKRYTKLPALKHIRIFVDTAAKTKQMNDYTVFGAYGLGQDGCLYVLGILRGKWEFTPMKQRAKDFWYKFKSISVNGFDAPLRDLVIEDKSAGIQLIQDLKREEVIPITPVQRNVDKYTRLQNVIGYINSGYLYVPDASAEVLDSFISTDWVQDFIAECEQFTGRGDNHDDQVDTLIDALQYMLANESTNVSVWERLF